MNYRWQSAVVGGELDNFALDLAQSHLAVGNEETEEVGVSGM